MDSTPQTRAGHDLAYDDSRREAVLFGGQYVNLATNPTSYPALGDTWVRPSQGPEAGVWIRQNPAQHPPARWGHSMAYMSSTHRTLLFGGNPSSYQALGDTWEWDGDSHQWFQTNPANSPPARSGAALAYDSTRSLAVLFGGGQTNGVQITHHR
jgi:hypothetical protein